MINLPPSPCLSQYLLSPKSHYHTPDVNTQGRQTSHNRSHRHIWCNQRNTEFKSKATLSCSCTAYRGDATSTTHRMEVVKPRKYRCRNHGVHGSEKMQQGFLGRSLVKLTTSNTSIWDLHYREPGMYWSHLMISLETTCMKGRYKNSKISVISMLYSISFSSNMYFSIFPL
jgi:hypothetical protein